MVNEVTPKLFARYPTAADYAGADRAELEEMIKPTGFFRNKTDSLIKLGQALEERYGGEVPGSWSTWSRCPASAARRPTSSSATPSTCPASLSTPTSPGSSAGGAGPTRLDPVKIETRDRQAHRAARLDDAVAPGDLPWPPGLPRPQAGLRRVPAGPRLPVLRRRPDRSVMAAKLVKGPRAAEIVAQARARDQRGGGERVGAEAVRTAGPGPARWSPAWWSSALAPCWPWPATPGPVRRRPSRRVASPFDACPAAIEFAGADGGPGAAPARSTPALPAVSLPCFTGGRAGARWPGSAGPP